MVVEVGEGSGVGDVVGAGGTVVTGAGEVQATRRDTSERVTKPAGRRVIDAPLLSFCSCSSGPAMNRAAWQAPSRAARRAARFPYKGNAEAPNGHFPEGLERKPRTPVRL